MTLKISPKFLKNLAFRLPFSRFFKLASWLFWSEEIILWHSVFVKINPGRLHEYFLYFFGAYSEEEIKKLIEFCKESHVFADVGANIGLVSLAVAYAYPRLEVFAFEAGHKAAGEFCLNLSLNPEMSERVHLVEKAAAEENGDLFFCPGLNCKEIELGRTMEDDPHSSSGYRVAGVRLDTFFRQLGKYPEVVKIDVEGAELQVLNGMKGLFEIGLPKFMLIEVHPCYFTRDVLDYKTKIKSILEESNYDLFLYNNGRQQELPAPGDWPGRLHILAFRK
jgi:FkbM family methyltransferase